MQIEIYYDNAKDNDNYWQQRSNPASLLGIIQIDLQDTQPKFFSIQKKPPHKSLF